MSSAPLLSALDQLLVQLDTPAPDVSRLRTLASELRRLAQETVSALEASRRESQNLAVFHTLQTRLFDQPTPERVCAAVEEVAVNFLGTEDFALFLRQGEQFHPQRGMGRTFAAAQSFREDAPARAKLVREGGSTVGPQGTSAQCCLVSPQGRTLAVLEVGSLLRHKARLTFEDRELLEMVRTRGGAALALALGHASA